MRGMREAAIVLCGGFSRRMGRDKWSLPFGDETLLDRTIRIVKEVVGEIVVVAREGQEVTVKDGDVCWAHDSAEGLGPLAGLAAGLRVMQSDQAFLTGCDTPFLNAAHLRKLFDAAQKSIAVPRYGGYFMVTSAVYPRTALPEIEKMLAAGDRRPYHLLDRVPHTVVEDPDPGVFVNINTEQDYERALKDAGLYSSSP